MAIKTHVIGNHILVGLGGTGGKILKAFKMRMFEEYAADPDARKKLPVALLYVDSTDEMMPKDGKARADFRVLGQDASFSNSEFFNIKAVEVDYILDHLDNYPSLRGIINNAGAVKSAIGSLGQAAGQKRRAGRLLFAANAKGFINCLRDAEKRCSSFSGSIQNNIYIFAGMAGGTGSGAVIDALVLARKHFPDAKINVFVMMPEMTLPKADMDQGRYYPNGYAALNELNGLQTGRWIPQDVENGGEIRLYNEVIKGIANGLTVYSNVNENGLIIDSLKELPKVVCDYVYARIFDINDEDEVNQDLLRAFNFENMDDYALEFDEAENAQSDGTIPVARTKKVNSFGIKRVIYPEQRIHNHITYSVGEGILYQFKYNNWRENLGFVNEERNKDYRSEYFSEENLSLWMLDLSHLMLEKKILPSDTDYPTFHEYWRDKALYIAEDVKGEKDPLNVLEDELTTIFTDHFRGDGVAAFFHAKERVLPEMTKEIRRTIEHNLFDKWHTGDISVVELQRVSKLLIECIDEIRIKIEEEILKTAAKYTDLEEERDCNHRDWARLGLLQRMVNVGARRFAEHQDILTDFFTCKTEMQGLEFAKKLASRLVREITNLDADISLFADKITEAIAETEKLLNAQRKVNKGIEDMKAAIVEVSEEESMEVFESEIKLDKTEMPAISRQLRDAMLPAGGFINFGSLAEEINIDTIKDAFDTKLRDRVKQLHNEKAMSEKKVLGLNILSQLRQQLRSDDDIRSFASRLIHQSGAFLKLSPEQIQLELRNNENNLSPMNPASINKKVIHISMPSHDGSEGMRRFAEKLKEAFQNSINQSTARTEIKINDHSPRKDELSVLTVSYCYPIRSLLWMKEYKNRYERFLNSGNPTTDACNAILLHSEGDGSQLPSLFPVENASAVAAAKAHRMQSANNSPQQDFVRTSQPTAAVAPSMLELPSNPGCPPPMPAPVKPVISLYIAISGQQYGPYNYDMCEQLVKGGQLNAQSLVWIEGLATWTLASQVPQLVQLLSPKPDFPPMPDNLPPPIPHMPSM